MNLSIFRIHFLLVYNFLLYELAFTELIFTKTLWPDLKTSIIKKYIQKFNNTERKFGI